MCNVTYVHGRERQKSIEIQLCCSLGIGFLVVGDIMLNTSLCFTKSVEITFKCHSNCINFWIPITCSKQTFPFKITKNYKRSLKFGYVPFGICQHHLNFAVFFSSKSWHISYPVRTLKKLTVSLFQFKLECRNNSS